MSITQMHFVSRTFVFLCGVCLVLSGCATMFAPSHDTVTIRTEPEGADVYDGANRLGKTPLTYSFKRDTFDRKTLSLKMKGHKSQELQLGRTLDKTSLWNFGYFITTMGGTCWLIDASSGNMIKYSPDSYLIELEGSAGAVNEHNYLSRLRFVLRNQPELSRDISRRGGDYLRAYYVLRSAELPVSGYADFLSAVSRRAAALLATDDPLDFFHALEAAGA